MLHLGPAHGSWIPRYILIASDTPLSPTQPYSCANRSEIASAIVLGRTKLDGFVDPVRWIEPSLPCMSRSRYCGEVRRVDPEPVNLVGVDDICWPLVAFELQLFFATA